MQLEKTILEKFDLKIIGLFILSGNQLCNKNSYKDTCLQFGNEFVKDGRSKIVVLMINILLDCEI